MKILLAVTVLLAGQASAQIPRSHEAPRLVLPNYAREVPAFSAESRQPIGWHSYLVNAGFGGGNARECRGGFLDRHWQLVDCVDRTAHYSAHGYLKHRGIVFDVYGHNEYQETIHFYEDATRELLWDNGVAQDLDGKRVMDPVFNLSKPKWAKMSTFNAYIVCNNAPRWSAIIDYDWLGSPGIGYGISQDNIGAPIQRVGRTGRYCDHCNQKFMHHLEVTGRLSDFRRRYKHIRDYATANLMHLFKQLPPYAKWSGDRGPIITRICDGPVMVEFLKFRYLSHLHNFVRYRRDVKLVAGRIGKEYDVHGNQGGFWMGLDAYQIVLSNFVDTVWFESAGLSEMDVLQRNWPNAWGPFRFQIGEAMRRPGRPLLVMTKTNRSEPAFLELEFAEESAGGGVLFALQNRLDNKSGCLPLVADYWRFRNEHRGLFAPSARTRHAQVAMVYSVPTMMYANYRLSTKSPPVNNLAGTARALEEGHIPYNVVIFSHPELYPDTVKLDDLREHRLLVVPAITCLSDSQSELIGQYLESGGTVVTVGNVGARDENNAPRESSPVNAWKTKGKVVDLLPDAALPYSRAQATPAVWTVITRAAKAMRALLPEPILSGPIPRMLWTKTWTHGQDCISVHLVNYDIDYKTAKPHPTEPFQLSLKLPEGVRAEEAVFLQPGKEEVRVELRERGGRVELTVPPVHVYGVLVVGRRDGQRTRSFLARGGAMAARARFACDSDFGDLRPDAERLDAQRVSLGDAPPVARARTYADAAAALLGRTAETQDQRLFAERKAMVNAEGATLALDFGARKAQGSWKRVGADTQYSKVTGYGWLDAASERASLPTAEERHYRGTRRKGKERPTGELNSIQTGGMPFWPYDAPIPEPLRTSLYSAAQRRFRTDLKNGLYEVAIVTSNYRWGMLNYRVSGMVSADGAVQLFDVPLKLGDVVSRRFALRVRNGHTVLTLGGATGWGVCTIVVHPKTAAEQDPLLAGALRDWSVSPRFANPDWRPIRHVQFSPETQLAAPDTANWSRISAGPNGLVELGTNRTLETGDVVYAASTIESPADRTVELHVGSASSALVWLNGKEAGYIPNQKGLVRSELKADVTLKKGTNHLVVKLNKFWERRWLFHASVTEGTP